MINETFFDIFEKCYNLTKDDMLARARYIGLLEGLVMCMAIRTGALDQELSNNDYCRKELKEFIEREGKE